MHFITNSIIFCLVFTCIKVRVSQSRHGLTRLLFQCQDLSSTPSQSPGNTTSSTPGPVLDHAVEYSDLPPAPDYRSSAEFDPRGMEHVYFIVNTFLDLILREEVLPKSKSMELIHHLH